MAAYPDNTIFIQLSQIPWQHNITGKYGDDECFVWSDGTHLKPADGSPYYTNWEKKDGRLPSNNKNEDFYGYMVAKGWTDNINGKYRTLYSEWLLQPCSSAHHILCEFNTDWELQEIYKVFLCAYIKCYRENIRKRQLN